MKRSFLTTLSLLFTAALISAGENFFNVSPALFASDEGEIVLSVAFSIPEHHYLYAEQIKVDATGPVELLPKDIPPPKQKYDQLTDTTTEVYEHDTTFTYTVKGNAEGLLEIQVQYQGCSESMCFLPEKKKFAITLGGITRSTENAKQEKMSRDMTSDWREPAKRFTVTGRTSGYIKPKRLIEFLDKAESGHGLERDSLRNMFEEEGFWIPAILIILGGLALNFTPCVLPMIPINIAIIGAGVQVTSTEHATQRRSRRRGFILGGMYGIGIVLVYGILGLMVVVAGKKFGTLNSSSWFNLGVAIIFLFMTLAMFGVFNVDFSKLQSRVSKNKWTRGSYLTAFILGGVAALLAGACVAPVIISVLILSADLYARGFITGLFLPFLLGAGMALPWPFAGAGLTFLPKPGKWMKGVNCGFGVIILLFAAWYGYQGYSLLRARSEVGKKAVVAAQMEGIKEGWMTSLDKALVIAERERKPIFVDFWASWCKSCLVMEKTTFRNPDVKRRFESYVKVKYRAEDLNDPDVKAVLDHFGVIGLPTYVVLVRNPDA